ncbi:MAG TPA: hypothetical protein VMQ62_00805 [Dongiaceae bacterium]|nr:hypothetical protein [Dongiaceae bacterium]
MNERRRSIALFAALVLAGAAACARDRSAPAAPAAPASVAPAAPAAAPASATPEAMPSSAAAPAPPLESGHAPFLSTLPAGGMSPHGDAGPYAGAIALVWDAPAGWIAEEPRNPMRRAQYRLAGVDGATDGECAVFYFGPGQGGDAQENVARWARMLTTPDGRPVEGTVSTQKVGDRTVTRVEAAGTYHPMAMTMGGTPPPPQPGWLLLGAVVPGPDANWFFRCAGPEKTIAKARPGFDGLIASVREAAE